MFQAHPQTRSRSFSLCCAAAVSASIAAAALAGSTPSTSDSTLAPPPNGMTRTVPGAFVITAGTVHTKPGESIEGGTVLIEDGFITGVWSEEDLQAADMEWPAGVRRIDVGDAHVYAAFVETYAEVDAPKPDAKAPGTHWNPRVTPQRSALDGPGITAAHAEKLREMGFGAAAIAPKGGIFRGQAAVVSLAEASEDESDTRPPVYAQGVYHSVGFETVGWGNQSETWPYPTSHMGAIAVIRQGLSDAAYLGALAADAPVKLDSDNRPVVSADGSFVSASGPNALTSLNDGGRLLFELDYELWGLHADDILNEAGRDGVLLGSGKEYWRLDAIAATGRPIIAPLNFPEQPKVGTPGEADSVGLRELLHWEQAPTNPGKLLGAGLPVALTTHEVEGKFFDRVRDAIKAGLSEDEALAMLTTAPASLLGMEGRLGEISEGAHANLLISSGPVFREKADLLEVWTDGQRHVLKETSPFDGVWTVTIADFSMELEIEGDTVTGREGEGDDVAESKARNVKIEGDSIRLTVDDDDDGTGAYPMTGTLRADGTIAGHGMDGAGNIFEWTATRDEAGEGATFDVIEPEPVPDVAGYPFGVMSYKEIPEQPETVVFTGATVWTAGPDGIIENGEIAVANGQIEYVGQARDRDTGSALVIDASGRHITPGLIDTHSHTGMFGNGFSGNEGGQTVTSEVRIADCIDTGHINFYRKLAGGTTTSGMLHGSANPIGGQNAVVKSRWGTPDLAGSFMDGAMPGIKFALGENVRRVNFGRNYGSRYPKSRMGVETVIRDRFTAAQRYAEAKAAAETEGRPFRRDLELEPLVEILNGERLVHCHSYRQDEIFMLCDVAEDFGFTIGTFQHVLEGYKVAERIRANALGASAFSDWWAFKLEVQDAIPWNGAIMHEAGVNVSFNSDDDSLSRRLNHEAAKAVRYGGIDPHEALKFLTINPATQLAIAHRVGSLEPGKEADLVIWSGDPLSTLSRPESVWIDGRNYFNLAKDKEVRAESAAQRERLLRKILDKPKKDEETEDGATDAEGDEGEAVELIEQDPERRGSLLARMRKSSRIGHYVEMYERGHDPTMVKCNACGCLFEMADFAGH